MKLLKISVAGVRGIVGQGMSVDTAISFAQAFSTYLEGGAIVIARDSRPSGPMMRAAVTAGLLACGSRVIDLGVAPSPSLQIYLQKLTAEGAILIAAGHNPEEWNALKFLRGDGMYLNSFQGEELLEIYNHGEFRKARWDEIPPLEVDQGALDYHCQRILQSFDGEVIRKRRFKVAVDCCNGACALLTPRLLEEAGCEVVAINDDIHRPFPRLPNPTPDNMSQLAALVKAAKADLGFAHDAEGERLGIVTDQGVKLRQEYTFAIACMIAMEKRAGAGNNGTVVTNLSTSSIIDVLAERAGVKVQRTPIGQAYVAESAQQMNALLAGEGSGQVILPWLHPGPDSLAAIVFMLEHLAKTGSRISELVQKLPRFHMMKENITLPVNILYARLQQFRLAAERESDGLEVDFTDGVKVSTATGWVHVRASNTEPLLRIIAEAPEEKRARELYQWARDQIVP